MICQGCGVKAPTRHVEFHQNIGALVMRFSRSVRGQLCKSCVNRHFWKMTGTTLVLGWWGMISLVVTPIFLVNNVVRYLRCLGMPPVPPGATAPVLSAEAVAKIQPHVQDLVARLKAGEPLATAAAVVAARTSVTPGQVVLFTRAVAEGSRSSERRRNSMERDPLRRGVQMGRACRGDQAVVPLADYQLLLTFDNGERHIFHVKPYLDKGIFSALKDPAAFGSVHVSFDTIEWSNGADLCPDALYSESVGVETIGTTHC